MLKLFFPFRIWPALGLLASLAPTGAIAAGSKAHVIAFGKWTTVRYVTESAAESGEENSAPLRIRPLMVDGRVKEFTFGLAHEVTERVFVVQRAFRLNDTLPQEPAVPLRWQWQHGGWMAVDRLTGRVSPIDLPEFDAVYSVVSWYRDYAAYCGVSDDDKKIYAVVAQVGRRKPVVKWQIGEMKSPTRTQEFPESACKQAEWQRTPARVTFAPGESLKRTYVIHGHAVDLLTDKSDDEEAEK